MRRIALLLLLAAMPLLASCAYPATHNVPRSVVGTVPLFDDPRPNCVGSTSLLIPAQPTDTVWVRSEWWQTGTMLKTDSLRTPRGVQLTFVPPVEVPSASVLSLKTILRDGGGSSCFGTYDQTPQVVAVKPASMTGLSVVP